MPNQSEVVWLFVKLLPSHELDLHYGCGFYVVVPRRFLRIGTLVRGHSVSSLVWRGSEAPNGLPIQAKTGRK